MHGHTQGARLDNTMGCGSTLTPRAYRSGRAIFSHHALHAHNPWGAFSQSKPVTAMVDHWPDDLNSYWLSKMCQTQACFDLTPVAHHINMLAQVW